MSHIPFIFRVENEGTNERVSGFDANLLVRVVSEAKGFGITGALSEATNLSGVNITGGVSLADRHKGLRISGIDNYTYNHSSGVEVSGVGSFSEKDSDQNGLFVGGVANYAGRTSKGIVQMSLFGNKVESVENDAFVLQIGLYNVAGNQVCPIVNVRGLRKLLGGKKK